MFGSSLDTLNFTLSQPLSGGIQGLPVLVSTTVALLKLFSSSTILKQNDNGWIVVGNMKVIGLLAAAVLLFHNLKQKQNNGSNMFG